MSNTLVFFGTHDFAKTILQSLIDAGCVVELVVTQPDRPVGRKQEMQKPATKLLAEQYGIPVFQPEKLKDQKIEISEDCQFAVCAQYGAIIPQSVLDLFPLGIINVHTSMLPKYRGASPIQSALRNGETQTGVTIMKMDKGMDTGAILSQSTIEIFPDETYPQLDARMAELGATLLNTTLPLYLNGSLIPEEQDHAQATGCKMISREDGKIDWNKTTEEIYNMYRAYTPWPGIWTMWGDKRLKLLAIKPSERKNSPGKAVVEGLRLFIGTCDSSVEIEQIQLEGKSVMTVEEFVRGYSGLFDAVQL
jgi:methionyl-tRNA formyltransferase